MRLKTDDEARFITTLLNHLPHGQKLIQGHVIGNQIADVSYEIRYMATAGGAQYGMAEIHAFTNQRGSGIYTMDPEEVYLRAIDEDRRHPSMEWILVHDREHTPWTIY